MADPHVHVALVGLGEGAKAAHQEDAVNRLRWIHPAWFVGERSRQALRFSKGLGVRLVMGNASRGRPRHIARQQRMIDVEKQWQQGKHALLACRQAFVRARQSTLAQGQEAAA